MTTPHAQTVKANLSVSKAFSAVEEAFAMLANGQVDVPQVNFRGILIYIYIYVFCHRMSKGYFSYLLYI